MGAVEPRRSRFSLPTLICLGSLLFAAVAAVPKLRCQSLHLARCTCDSLSIQHPLACSARTCPSWRSGTPPPSCGHLRIWRALPRSASGGKAVQEVGVDAARVRRFIPLRAVLLRWGAGSLLLCFQGQSSILRHISSSMCHV